MSRAYLSLLLGLIISARTVLGQDLKDGKKSPQPLSHHEHQVTPGPLRWRGTIGKQSVTLVFDTLHRSGSYYYDRHGQNLELHAEGKSPRRPLILRESTAAVYASGFLHLQGAFASQLAGTWRSPNGRRSVPLALHEDYTAALRYDEELWTGAWYGTPDDDAQEADSAFLQQYYLRVRLPQNPAAEQRLQQALGPPVPEPRMAYHLDTLLSRKYENGAGYYYLGDKWLCYNSNYLLSLVQYTRFRESWEDTGHEWWEGQTYDLRTGRRLHLQDLLVPGYKARLSRLLLAELPQVWENPYYDGIGANGQVPAGGFVVSGTGLTFTYDERADESLASPGPYHADRTVEVELTYEQLLPLIRPAGPLGALLKERGLLPKK